MADAAPADCGVNVRVKDAVPPAGIVIGSDGPVNANSEVLTDAEFTVTLEPVALSVAERLLLAPTPTLPKLKLPGLTENWPEAAPVPESEMDGAVPDALETNAMVPLSDPADCGEKLTLKVKV